MGAWTTANHSAATAGFARARAGTRPKTLDQTLLRGPWVNLLGLSPKKSEPISKQEQPLTGEPDALIGPVRFGGRGEVNPSLLPLFFFRPPGFVRAQQ